MLEKLKGTQQGFLFFFLSNEQLHGEHNSILVFWENNTCKS